MNPTARSYWWSKQGLEGSLLDQSCGSVLLKSGWARSVGGANPYLQLFSRNRASKAQIDAEVAAGLIQELPSARGCTYVLPSEHFGLGLSAGKPAKESQDALVAKRELGVTDAELSALKEGVVRALDGGKLSPRELSKALGGLIRNLGEEGKKRGQTTTLPIALGELQGLGQIRRVPRDGRLDQQRFDYAIWSPSPLPDGPIPFDQAMKELARQYWGWAGPAKPEHFRWFTGLGVKASQEAMAGLSLVDVGEGYRLLQDELDSYITHQIPSLPEYALVASLDSHLLLRRDVPELISAEDVSHPLLSSPGGGLSGLDLPNHAILDRGRIIGLWEFDPEQGDIVWTTFRKPDDRLRDVISQTEPFVRDQLGDAKSFSLDSPVSRKPRIEALRTAMSK